MEGLRALCDKRFELVLINALGGDAARSFAAGFDDHLPQPFRRSPLLAVPAHRMNPQPLPEPAPNEAAPAAAAGEVLDAAALQRLRELDPTGANRLLARVLTAFQTSTDRLLPQMKDARVAGDLQGVRHVAHTLKSSSASIGALKLSELCAQLEAMLRHDKVDALQTRVDGIAAEVEVVLQALQKLMGPRP